MALGPITKGIALSCLLETYANKQRRNEKDHFRFAAGGIQDISMESTRLAPGDTWIIKSPGAQAAKLLIIRTTGDATVSGNVDGSTVSLKVSPLLVLTGVVLGDLTITNTDTSGTPSKDVVAHLCV